MTVFDEPQFGKLFANIDRVREYRSAFLDEIKAGEVPLAAAFERANNDEVLASMKVLAVIEGLPEAGKVQTRRAFEELGVDEAAHIADVSADAIVALPDALKRHSL